jgi:hypothetical protein
MLSALRLNELLAGLPSPRPAYIEPLGAINTNATEVFVMA